MDNQAKGIYPEISEFDARTSGRENPPPYSVQTPHSETAHHNLPSAPVGTPMYIGAQPQQSTTVVFAGGITCGPKPQTMTCPSCHASIKTRVEHKATSRTHLIALLLCLFCCWCCCCCPYCMDSCRAGNHYCPNCQSFIGSYQS